MRHLWLSILLTLSGLALGSSFSVAQDLSPVRIVDSVPAGSAKGVDRFYLRVGATNIGVDIQVPVLRIVGARPGKTLMLTAAIHGDELNGIRVIHQLADRITVDQLAGTLLMVPGMNPTGLAANSRFFLESGRGGGMVDLNRIFPGDPAGGTAQRVAHTLWQTLTASRPDLAIDLHTQTRGTEFPLFVYADFDNPTVKQMAVDLLPDMIKRDPGESGTWETTLMERGVPALTLEIGAPKRFQSDLVDRAAAGIMNVMRRHHMLQGTAAAADVPPVIGTRFYTLRADHGGAVLIDVRLKEKVSRDQIVARQVDAFGRLVKAYRSPVAGHVVSVATDPLRQPGTTLVRVLY